VSRPTLDEIRALLSAPVAWADVRAAFAYAARHDEDRDLLAEDFGATLALTLEERARQIAQVLAADDDEQGGTT
jgi:hypothetical protein